MRRLDRLPLLCFIALGWGATLVLPSSSAAAETAPSRTLTLSAGQALALGERQEASGNMRTAMQLYAALAQDPSPPVRAEARFRLARILARQGKLTAAAVQLRRLVDEQPDAGAARISLAQLLDRMGDIDGARRQLRAAQAAGLPRNIADLSRRYADSLRSRAPYGWTLEIAAAPDSNINRATRSDTLSTVIGDFQVGNDAKARSGIGLSLGGSGFVRVGVADELAWVSRAQLNGDRYRDTDFNRLNMAVASGLEWSPGAFRLALDAGLGRSRLGGRTYQRYRQLGLRAYRPLGSRTAASLNLGAARIDNRFNDFQDGRSLSAGLAVDRALSERSVIQLSLSGTRFHAADPGYSTRSWEAGLSGAVDIGRWTLSAGAARGGTIADERLSLFPERRKDRLTRLSLGVTSRQIEWQGFSPLVRLTVERNMSTVELWDYSRRRLEVGAIRAF